MDDSAVGAIFNSARNTQTALWVFSSCCTYIL